MTHYFTLGWKSGITDFLSDMLIGMISKRHGFMNNVRIIIRIYGKILVIWVVMIDVIAQ